jgi:hypothetical protein
MHLLSGVGQRQHKQVLLAFCLFDTLHSHNSTGNSVNTFELSCGGGTNREWARSNLPEGVSDVNSAYNLNDAAISKNDLVSEKTLQHQPNENCALQNAVECQAPRQSTNAGL